MTDAPSPIDTPATPQRLESESRIPVAKIAGLLAIVAIVAAAAFFWMDRGPGVPYPVSGEVRFNGKPLATGYLEFLPVRKRNAPARIVAPLDANGKFEAWSEIDSRLLKGVPAGKYKVLVQAHHPSPGLGAPSRLLPDIFYSEGHTPVEITVTSDPSKHEFVIDQTGEFQPNVAGGERPRREEPEEPAEADSGKQP
jgi:hypothetical protein